MHGRRWSLERLEHHLHSSSAQVLDHLIGHCAEQPRAGKFGVDRRIEAIDTRPGAKCDPPFGPVGSKSPSGRQGHALERDHAVSRQILGRRRNAVRCQVVGAGEHYMPDLSEADGDETAVRQCADADRSIDLIIREMSHTVGQHQADGRQRKMEPPVRELETVPNSQIN